MSRLEIKNGLVFDPLNKIEGEIKDILIEDGKIVEKFSTEKDINIIDAKSKTVIPSGIDIHCHVASQQLNWVRLIGSKNKIFSDYWKGITLQKIAHDYLKNGYTFVLEANVFPSLAMKTVFNFNNLPVLDKGFLLNVSNLWPLELEFQKAKIEELSTFLLDLLGKTHAFGMKAYNPFESENWNFKVLRDGLDTPGRLYNFTPMDVYLNLIKANEFMHLPHSLHVHVEGYESIRGKENLNALLEKINSLEYDDNPNNDAPHERSQIIHLAHVALYNVDADNGSLIEAINSSPRIDVDLGIIGFNPINPLISSDRGQIKELKKGNEIPVIKSAIESEGDQFSTIRTITKNDEKFSIFWLNAMSLALKIKNKWQVQFSTNYPNHGDINDTPKMLSLLMSNEKRTDYLNTLNAKKYADKFLNGNNESLTFNDIIIITRASPAKSLGIAHLKGNLGSGADGDVNILDVNMNDIELPKEVDAIEKAFLNLNYVVKGGNIVKQNDNIDLEHRGYIYQVQDKEISPQSSNMINKKKEYYMKFSASFYDSFFYSIDEKYVKKIGK